MGTARPPKVRHRLLSVLLWWLLIANALVAAASPVIIPAIRGNTPGFQLWVVWPIAALGAFRVACVAVLFLWKRWGFYGYAAASVEEMLLNVYAGVEPAKAPLWLIGTVALAVVLQLGRPKSGWSQLDG